MSVATHAITGVDMSTVLPQHEIFHAQALKTPNAVAVTDGSVTLTYGAFSASIH